jgi:hypothetical protein
MVALPLHKMAALCRHFFGGTEENHEVTVAIGVEI